MSQKKLNLFLSYKTTLYRVVNEKTRYYSLEILPTIFGEYLLIRSFGGVKNKKPTRIIKEYFSHKEDGIKAFEKLVAEKVEKGYYL